MILRTHIAAATLLLTCALPAWAQFGSNESVTRELPIRIGGTFVLENTSGDIDLVGTDDTKVVVTAEKSVRALDKASLEDGRDQTQLAFLGDARILFIKTIVPPIHSGRWTSGIKYVVRVPRTVNIKIVSTNNANRIHVADMRGNVVVNSFNGVIVFDGVTGPTVVMSANGNIFFNAPQALADAILSTANGSIEVRAPAGSKFQWVAETIKGDARTNFTVNGTYIGPRFRGSVNGLGGPTITTKTLNGNILVLQSGTHVASARSLRTIVPPTDEMRATEVQRIEKSSVRSNFRYVTTLGDVLIGEIHGNADITTGAGEVQLGIVFGDCQVVSKGGPVTLGDIVRNLTAHTEAGDVVVQSAREGGTITTGGGIIRLLFTGGPTRLQSGGGDIVVRQAAAPIYAETQSGDITITIDPASKSEKVTAKTAKGSVLLNVTPSFAAEIDATVITSDPDKNKILSDLTGLSFRREQIGGKTKIRATGRVNGGGERVELYAEDGGIQISTRGLPATR
ncbi:MAG TPA: DUF4097 family beta strand repeat-containing protein [Thermoanaerobaculia bacterium]|jgi:DUF4097 and DUF4098 domain-containing protein YvlB|nr:DUF4097 family beta strand repeat-containing protein [Thermoanaerobaculia bacterium]